MGSATAANQCEGVYLEGNKGLSTVYALLTTLKNKTIMILVRNLTNNKMKNLGNFKIHSTLGS